MLGPGNGSQKRADVALGEGSPLHHIDFLFLVDLNQLRKPKLQL